MDKTIYVNVAAQSRQQAEPLLKKLREAGIQVMTGNIGEDTLKEAGLVMHLLTDAYRTSKTCSRMKNMAHRLQMDEIQLHIPGESKGTDADLLLTAALEFFKFSYRDKPEEELPEAEELPQTSPEEEPLANSADEKEAGNPESVKEDASSEWKLGTIPEDTRAEIFQEGMELLGGEEGASVSSAIALIMKAANQGYAPAQYQLSICYDEGLGVARNLQEAARWREMAAYGGIVKAQGEMGYCYEWGQGVPRNIREAVKWYQLAAEQGDSQSKNNLAYCYQKGRGVTKDMVQAMRLYTEAAQAGDPSAQYNLAYCYWYGEGTAINKERAIELFKQSMAGGNAKAAQMMRILGRYDYVSSNHQEEE